VSSVGQRLRIPGVQIIPVTNSIQFHKEFISVSAVMLGIELNTSKLVISTLLLLVHTLSLPLILV